jgi:hypothetical protein
VIRISSSPVGAGPVDPAAERAAAPPSSTPFGVVLRAAGRARPSKPGRAADPPAPTARSGDPALALAQSAACGAAAPAPSLVAAVTGTTAGAVAGAGPRAAAERSIAGSSMAPAPSSSAAARAASPASLAFAGPIGNAVGPAAEPAIRAADPTEPGPLAAADPANALRAAPADDPTAIGAVAAPTGGVARARSATGRTDAGTAATGAALAPSATAPSPGSAGSAFDAAYRAAIEEATAGLAGLSRSAPAGAHRVPTSLARGGARAEAVSAASSAMPGGAADPASLTTADPASPATADPASPIASVGASLAAPVAGPPTGSAARPSERVGDTGSAAGPSLAETAAASVRDDSPVAAWIAASVGRAIGSFSRDPVAAGAATGPVAAGSAIATAHALPGLDPVAAMTPLEQAVHQLVGQAIERGPGRGRRGTADDSTEPAAGAAPAVGLDGALGALVPGAGAAGPGPLRAGTGHGASPVAPGRSEPSAPDSPSNPSHVHLVLDDGPERVVVTVAVRGSEVHVALRGSDDATTAALARNAGSLDHAMRARGLALDEFSTEREPSGRGQRQPADPEPRERRKPTPQAFKLEDLP